MFRRADQLLVEAKEDDFKLHVLEFSWDGFEPSLTVFDSEDKEVSEFDLQNVDFYASNKRKCIGYFDDNGHVPCPKGATVEKLAQCPECCREVFLPDQACIFDPKCDGENPKCGADKQDTAFCRRDHVIYIAFYDTHAKVGLSSTRRVERRLVEQGADAFAIVGTLPNREKAREEEKRVSAKLDLPQWIKQDTQLRNFSRKIDVAGIEQRYEGLKATLSSMPSLKPEELRWLDGYPIRLPLTSTPKPLDSCGRHKGQFVGIKGKWLVYESDGFKALNLSDLPSRYLSRGL